MQNIHSTAIPHRSSRAGGSATAQSAPARPGSPAPTCALRARTLEAQRCPGTAATARGWHNGKAPSCAPHPGFRASFLATAALAAVITVGASAASATPVPALFANPAMCPASWVKDAPDRSSNANCHLVIEPKTWYWTSDGSAGLIGLHWLSWTALTASATGTLVQRTPGDVAPASGEWQKPPKYAWHHYLVYVNVLYPVTDEGRYVFGIVDVEPQYHSQLAAVGYQTVPDLI